MFIIRIAASAALFVARDATGPHWRILYDEA